MKDVLIKVKKQGFCQLTSKQKYFVFNVIFSYYTKYDTYILKVLICYLSVFICLSNDLELSSLTSSRQDQRPTASGRGDSRDREDHEGRSYWKKKHSK